jgi:NAD(P)-dependent dehydrogenase (short-subunit alcohol dehydrogenase family)
MADGRELTRRGLFRQQAALGAGYLATGALLGADRADAATAPALAPRFYPLPDFSPDIDLRGKTAVITGASTGIGRATGEALASHGVHVIGSSRSVPDVKDPPDFTLLELDITEQASIEAFVKKVRRRAGRVDILINNAGRGIFGSVLPPDRGADLYLKRLELGIKTDYLGHVAMTQRMRPLLPKSGYARVAFTVSVAGYTVATGAMAPLHGYASMKRALLGFANGWRSTLEQAGSHIRVSTVNPYVVNTRFPDNLILTEKAPKGSPVAEQVRLLRRVFRGGLPPALVGEAYRQLLSSAQPPANVAVGSAAEPYASMGGNALAHLGLLDENSQAALELGC